MRKIFSILVVLMMVAGTFVSCNMPTNADTNVSNNGSDTTAATYEVTKVKDDDGHICVIEFGGKKFWCTVEAAKIIVGNKYAIDVPNYYIPKCDGIKREYDSYFCKGAAVTYCLVYAKTENIKPDDRYITLNDGNTGNTYYYDEDNYIRYKY